MIRNGERSFLLLLILIALSTVVNAQTPTPQGTPSPQAYLPTGAVAWLYAAGALASALASVAAWYAKIRWGKELETVYQGRISNLENHVKDMQSIQAETMKARDERLDNMKETKEAQLKIKDDQIAALLKSKEDEIATLLKSKEGEIATWKAFSSMEVMNTIKARTEMLQQIVEERNTEIEKLQRQVLARPLDAAHSALEIEKLKLEKDYIALVQAYEMKVSSQRFSDQVVSGEDKGKIESARDFINQLVATKDVGSQSSTEEARAEQRDTDGASRKTPIDEELTGKTK